MNFPLICRYLSLLSVGFGCLFGICLFIGVYYKESSDVQLQWWGIIGVTFVTAFFLYIASYRQKIHRLLQKEALCIVGSGWGLFSILGALPFLVIVPHCTITDALFEAVSGLTTTGGTVFKDVESFPHSVLFWRSLSQWVGGIGIVTVFVALFSFVGASGKVLYSRESSGRTSDMDTSRIQQGAWQILKLYCSLSFLCCIAFHLCGLGWFDAVCHMFGAIATGGFSTKNASFAAFNNAALEWTAIVFMAIGGVSFLLVLKFLRGNWRALWRNTELKGYLCLLVLGSLLMAYFVVWQTPSLDWSKGFRDAAFQVTSILTTTGFISANYQAWLPVTHLFFLMLMFIGGCTASTSGGLKVVRAILVGKISIANVEKAFQAGIVRPIVVNQTVLDENTQRDVVAFFVLYILVAALGFLCVGVLEPAMSCNATISAVLSCVSNIGPGLNEVANDYSCLHASTKIFLTLLMVVGRLELYALLVFFLPSFWRRFN